MAEFPQSREEAILQATINGEEYTGYPESRIEALLLELKAVIEGGGGGGGTTNYNLLENKPQIGGVTLTGDKSASDLSLASTSRLADAENMVCAEFFDASKAYTKDTYVIYNDGLYKFKSAHTAGAAWDATIVDEVDLLTVIQEATNPTIAPPVLNKESVVSENDVNTLSAILTAQQTSAYMLILSICNSESFPTLTTCTVSVNLEAKTVSDYYVSEGYGIASKYVLLNLEAGDSIAATIASNVDVFGTSASIMLVRLSSSINGLTLKDAEFSNNYVDPTLNFNVEKDAVYLLWFFNRSDGVGTFKTLKKNNANIATNKIVCSSGSGWQISHGMCMVYAKALDTFAVAIQFNGYFDAVGVFEVLMDTGESYNELKDKPQINGVTLSGNKSLSDLGIPTALASLTDDATHRTVTDAEKSTWNTVGEAIETEKTVSGNPITVTDALPYPAVSLSAEIEASQDLHGYDKPWVGGAGKNKLPMTVASIKAINTSGTWDGNAYTYSGITYTLLTDADGNITGIDTDGTVSGYSMLYLCSNFAFGGGTNLIVTDGTSDSASDTFNIRVGNSTDAYVANTIGGETSFTADTTNYIRIAVQNNVTLSNKLFKPMVRLSSVSDASYAPYSNICPISGRTAVSVVTEGKNLTYNVLHNVNINSSAVLENNYGYNLGLVRIIQGMDYIVTTDDPTGFVGGFFYDEPTIGSVAFDSTRHIAANKKFTAPITGYVVYRTTASYTTPQCEHGTVATAYEPYKGITVTVVFEDEHGDPITVFGGSLNLTTGVLTVTHAKDTLIWGNGSGSTTLGDCIRRSFALASLPVRESGNISDVAPYLDAWTTDTPHFYAAADGIAYFFLPVNTASDTSINICYKLATPTTIQLTPTQLQMLKGYNLLSSDGGGDITLTYKANKVDSVQAKVDVLETTKADNADVVDYIENGNTASRAYTANQFMLWKGDLYKVTTSIASGATITAGTNVSKTTIGAVLTAILNA